MTTKIEKLTPEQEKQLVIAREAYRAIGVRTGHDAACEAEGNQAILDARREIGAPAPDVILWARSTKEALLMAWNHKRKSNPALGEPTGKDLRDCWSQWSWGQTEMYWLGRYRFAIDVVGVKVTEEQERRLAIRERLARACYGVITADTAEIAIMHPTIAKFDDAYRLHSEDGHALEFADGYGVACWHGTTIPVEWVRDRANLDPKIALTETNIERRRAAAEIVGWARVLKSVTHREIDKDPDPEIGTLLSVDLPDAPDSRFVLVKCATGRDFALPVPREMKTALEANAWTYDIKPIDLETLEVRT
jgi:hypothetical protein